MDDVPYNGKQINGAGFLANPVDLPAAEAVVEFVVFERNSVTLSGGTVVTFQSLADLSKVAPLGIGTLDLTVDLSAELTRSQTIYFGDSETGFSFDSAGGLTLLALFPASTLSYGWDTTAQLTRLRLLNGATTQTFDLSSEIVRQRPMSGTSAIEFNHSGVLGATQYLSGLSEKNLNVLGKLDLFSPNYIGYASVEMSMEFAGTLMNYGAMQGSSSKSMDTAGDMIALRRLTGDLGITSSVAGILSNNAGVMDLTGFLMTRRKTNREMTR